MHGESARVCPDCGATVPNDLNECWLCHARAESRKRNEEALRKVSQAVKVKKAPPETALGREKAVSDLKDQTCVPAPLGIFLLTTVAAVFISFYAAACLGLFFPTSMIQRAVLIALIVPATLRTLTLSTLQQRDGAPNPGIESVILFAGSLAVMVATALLAIAAFLVIAIPLSLLSRPCTWNGSNQHSSNARETMAMILGVIASLATSALMLFETWIAYHVFRRPKGHLLGAVSRFLRLQRGIVFVIASFAIGAGGVWLGLIAYELCGGNANRILSPGDSPQGFILVAATFFLFWGGASILIWSWVIRRGYRIH